MRFIYLLLAVTFVTGCQSQSSESLIGTKWQWVSSSADSVEIAPDDPAKFQFIITEKDKFSVKADCNRGQGSFSLEKASIDIGLYVLTRAMCAPNSMDRTFLSQLESVSEWHLKKKQLVLSGDFGHMTFERF